MTGFLSEEQKAAAEQRAGAGGPEAEPGKAAAEAPTQEVPAQEEPKPQSEEGSASPAGEKPTAEPETVTVPLEGGRQIEVDRDEANRLIALGLEAGDPDMARTARLLENYVEKTPGGKAALKALIDNPEAAQRLADEFGGDATETDQETPEQKELRELREENARLKQGNEQPDQMAALRDQASKYPALKGLSDKLLAASVRGLVAEGHSVTSALATIASEASEGEAKEAEGKARTATRADRLRGVGSGGSAPSVTPEGEKPKGADLGSGTVLQRARARLAGG